MFSPSHMKSLQALISLKSPFSFSSALTSTKLRSFIHTLIISRMCRIIIRALSKLKTLILHIFRDNHPIHHYNNKNNIILGSFRLHYNWCSSKSSHVFPVPKPNKHKYYDYSTNVTSEQQDHQEDCPDSQLAGYLQWLEEKLDDDDGKDGEINEIDMLAEMFIANCHEKFKLEKQESDRRFQEMLARSM
ncbi:DUF761 domain protein [Senna tora]|uniref:DUF761 domain protein n=1 Tax=Senna tora TaxID=362788 RepID=A0A834TBC1_9FABA|nr:DUF761 domain protein [Senna tora]